MPRIEPIEKWTGRSPELQTAGDELQEVESGRNPATPAWMLISVILAVGVLFAVALAVVALAYVLA